MEWNLVYMRQLFRMEFNYIRIFKDLLLLIMYEYSILI